MNVIFLDVDGVLNSYETTEKTPLGYTGIEDQYVENLATLVREFDAIIVLTSDWKSCWELDYNACDEDGKYLTDKLNAFDLTIYDKTLDDSIGNDFTTKRGSGIRRFLENNDVEAYVILDDIFFMDFTDDLPKHFVFISEAEGFNSGKLKLAIQCLSGVEMHPEEILEVY